MQKKVAVKRQKKKKVEAITLSSKKVGQLQTDYENELKTNKLYSLDVDPEDIYHMGEQQKEFIKYYVEYKNINAAAQLANINLDTAKQLFVSYSSQQEIRRINKAMYHRQFSAKLLNMDEIGGYLSSLITDENVPFANQLSTSEKVRVMQMLIDLNLMKQKALVNPETIMSKDIGEQIKTLSIDTIKQLLTQLDTTDDIKKKTELLNNYSKDNELTIEEKAYLETLSLSDLLQIIEDSNGGGDKK